MYKMYVYIYFQPNTKELQFDITAYKTLFIAQAISKQLKWGWEKRLRYTHWFIYYTPIFLYFLNDFYYKLFRNALYNL